MSTYFPKLRSAQTVEKALDRICAHEIMGVIIGAPGVGKSEPLRHWRRMHAQVPHVWIEATLGGTMSALVAALAQGLGIGVKGLDATSIRIAEELARNPRAVLIDESDFLQSTATTRARAIYDRAQSVRDDPEGRAFPLVFIGTEALRTKLMRDEERSEQILSRVGEFDVVPKMSLAECAGVLQAKYEWGDVSVGPGGTEAIWRLSRGSFRWLNKIVPLAIDLAGRDGKVITPEIVTATKRYLVGAQES
jgi:hypothetical protein